MSTANTQWILDLKENLTSQLKVIDGQLASTAGSSNQVNQSFKQMSAIDLYAIANSFEQLNNQLQKSINPGVKFQDGLKDVEAITGVTGTALESLGVQARNSAKKFGGDAAQDLDTYKVLLSKLGPDIAKSEEALVGMENNARILSKTMKNDLAGATDALTTAMLQYKVDLQDPIKAQKEMTDMMNIMAAGAKYGSAEIPSISEALKVAGVQAKQSNVSFAETNAALQELSRGGKDGSEAGNALRNVLGKMAGEDVIPQAAVEKLRGLGVDMNIVSDISLPFTTRLQELKKAQADATLIAQIFGVENAAAANILLDSIDAQEELQTKIVGTNTAYEQAEIKMSSYSEWLSRQSAQLKDVGIRFFGITKNVAPAVSVVANFGMVYANLSNVMKGFNFISLTSIKRKIADSVATNGYIGTLKIAASTTWSFIKAKVAEGWQFVKNIAYTGVGAVAALGSYIIAVVSGTAAQWGLNVAMTANPIGAVIVGVAALVAGLVALFFGIKTIISKWQEWGAAFTLVLGPLGAVIALVMSFKNHWDDITAAFKHGGMVEGIKAIGATLLDALLMPIQQLLELLSNIPGLGGLAGKGADMIADLRSGLFNDYNRSEKGSKKTHQKENDKNQRSSNHKERFFDEPLEILTTDSNKSTKESNNSSSSSNGGSRSISLNVEVNNYFSEVATNVKEIAEEVTGEIIDKLRDGVISFE